MTLVPVGPGSTAPPADCTDTVEGVGYEGQLTVTCDFANVPVNTYTVEVSVQGGYYTGAGEDVVNVFDPSLGFTTGGGWFYWPGTFERTNFGVNMKFLKNKKVQGSLLLIRHLPNGTIYRVKSNALYGLAIGEMEGGSWATANGKATYLEPGWAEPEGNYEFVAYVEDRGEPGSGADRFWIQVIDKSGGLTTLSMAPPTTGNAAILEGGNVIVPH